MMKTILELIESWKPCSLYKVYRISEALTPESTLKSILHSNSITTSDKQWFFGKLLNKGKSSGNIVYVRIQYHSPRPITVSNMITYTDYTYTYGGFLDMVDEYLEHANIDAAI